LKRELVLASGLSFFVGVLVGNWLPSAQVEALETELATAQRPRSFIADLLGGTDRPPPTPKRVEQRREAGPSDQPSVEPVAEPPLEDQEPPPMKDVEPSDDYGDAPPPIEEWQRISRDAAWTVLVEDVGIDEVQEAAIQNVWDDMNAELVDVLSDYPELSDGYGPEELDRMDAMFLASDALNVVATAEENVRGIFSEEQRERLDVSATNPMIFLDRETLGTMVGGN